jgi:hypothetical protein
MATVQDDQRGRAFFQTDAQANFLSLVLNVLFVVHCEI